MLYGLFSLQINLHISLHYQSDVLWHTCSNYKQLLFSSLSWYMCHRYMCSVLYVTLIWCSSVQEMYSWLLGGQWHSYNKGEKERGPMCICDVKWWNGTGPVQCYLHISGYEIQCSGVPVIYAWLTEREREREREGLCAYVMWNSEVVICLYSTISVFLNTGFSVVVFQWSLLNWWRERDR